MGFSTRQITNSRAPFRFNYWKIVAIVSVLGYRSFVYGSIIYVKPLAVIEPSILESILWTIAGITVIMYLKASCTDPGLQEWCPSIYLTSEEKKRSDDVKLQLLRHNSQDDSVIGPSGRKRNKLRHGGPFVISSDEETSSLSNDSSEQDSDTLPGFTMVTDLEQGEIDFGLPGLEQTISRVCTGLNKVQDGPVILGQSNIRRLHLHEEIREGSPLQIMEPSSEVISSLKVHLIRSRLLRLYYSFGRRLRSLQEWCYICWTPYFGSWHSRPRHLEPDPNSQEITLCRDLFSMGVHNMYQGGEKLQFCNICCIWKLLRTKHCRSCGSCVRLHDHHCPWLGVCVGEKNRLPFLYFLGWQTIELILAVLEIIVVVIVQDAEWMDDKPHAHVALSDVLPRVILLVMILILFSLCIMTTCLYFYHAFLIGTNLTTWESLSWHKISYMKNKKRAYGSPFGSACWKINFALAALPSAVTESSKSRIMGVGSLSKYMPSCFIYVSSAGMLWRTKKPGERDYAQVPPCTINPCCNLYEACL